MLQLIFQIGLSEGFELNLPPPCAGAFFADMKPTVRHARAHDASPTEHLSPVAVESVPTGVALTSAPVQTPEVTLPVRQSPTVPQAPGTFSATTVPVAVPSQTRAALYERLALAAGPAFKRTTQAGHTPDLAITPQGKNYSQSERAF